MEKIHTRICKDFVHATTWLSSMYRIFSNPSFIIERISSSNVSSNTVLLCCVVRSSRVPEECGRYPLQRDNELQRDNHVYRGRQR